MRPSASCPRTQLPVRLELREDRLRTSSHPEICLTTSTDATATGEGLGSDLSNPATQVRNAEVFPSVNGSTAKRRPGPVCLQAPRCCRRQGKHGCPMLGLGSSSGCPGGSAAGRRANAVSRSRRCIAQSGRTRALCRRGGEQEGGSSGGLPVGKDRDRGESGTAAHGQDAESRVRVIGPEQIRKIIKGDQLGRTTSAAGAQWCASAAPLSAPRIAGQAAWNSLGTDVRCRS